ncbi:MAG: hypothetical protein C3F02_03910 [Parcubacteria group bacterium]|nr:MAG: hypothetical protein C3F02_03910 [Parcubacteria group bacterium]
MPSNLKGGRPQNVAMLLVIVLFVAIIFISGVYLWQKVPGQKGLSELGANVQVNNRPSRQTYADVAAGISFEFPREYIKVQNQLSPVRFEQQENNSSITYYTLQTPIDFDTYCPKGCEAVKNRINIGGQDFLQLTMAERPCAYQSNYLNYRGKTYVINLGSCLIDDNYMAPRALINDEGLKKEILSSIKFTDNTADWQSYENKDLGLAFKYPNTWGAPKLSYVDSSMTDKQINGPAVFSGKGAWIDFSSASVRILLASADFEQFLIDSYNGGQDLSRGCSLLKADYEADKKKYCAPLKVAGQSTYGYFENINMECSGDSLLYSVPLNIPRSNVYWGLKIYFGMDGFPIATNDQSDVCGRPQSNIDANLQAYFTRINLDDKGRQNLEIMDQFLASFKFTDSIADWQTYTFKESGYSIKMPKSWVGFSVYDGSSYKISDKGPESFQTGSFLTVGAPDSNGELAIAVHKGYSMARLIAQYYSGKKISDYTTSQGLKVKLISGFSEDVDIKKVYVLEQGEDSYQINIANDTDIAQAIVDSFKFTDQNADWQTYTSTNYKLSFTYPKNWTIYDKLANPQLPHAYVGINLTSPEFKNDFNWGITTTDAKTKTMAAIVQSLSSPSADKLIQKEDVYIDGVKAVKITITNKKDSNWFWVIVVFEKDGKIYQISNGAIKDDKFETFYKSVKFIK